MKKYKLLIMGFLITFISVNYAYSFSLNEFTAKLDVDRANILMRKGDYEGAVTLYEKALSKIPNSPRIFYNMGTTMASMGEMHTASELFDMAKKNTADKTSDRMKSYIYYNSGITKIEIGD